MKRDPLAALRLADPARRVDLDAVDHGALDALREAITMTPQPTPVQPPRSRLVRRIVAATAGLTVLGGGIAYATFSTMFAGGANDGLTCMAGFIDPETIDWKANPTFGGVKLTADPVADCATYAAKAGQAAIPNPVAFRYKGFLVVAPSDQVPADAQRVAAPDASAQAAVLLTRALEDMVDRPADCMTADQARSFAADALAEVGLTGWTIQTASTTAEGCFFPLADAGQATVSLKNLNAAAEQPSGYIEDPKYAQIDAQSAVMIRALRAGISDTCVSLAEAEKLAAVQAQEFDRVTRQALGSGPGTPVIAEPDNTKSCASVDIKPGGSFTIVVRGPQTARK